MDKETYNQKHKKIIAISIIIILGFAIIYLLKTYVTPLVLAALLTLLTYPIYKKLSNKIKRPLMSASIMILMILIIIIVPLSIFSGILISQINDFTLTDTKINLYETKINELTGLSINLDEYVDNIFTYIKEDGKRILQNTASFTSNFFLKMFIMFYIYFYFLLEKNKILKYIVELLPFSKHNSENLINESGKISKAILIGQVFTAIIQGMLGLIAFIIAGIPNAIIWGIIMIILSLIPVIGAFLIWLPAGVFLIIEGNTGMGIFILIWGALVISQIDNIIRPKLVNRFADIHPVETLLGIFMGIAAFGMIGIILGPLMLSLFTLLIRTYKKEYVTI